MMRRFSPRLAPALLGLAMVAGAAAPAAAQRSVSGRPPVLIPPRDNGRPPVLQLQAAPGTVYDASGARVAPTGESLPPGTTPEGTLRCTKAGDRARVHNVGSTTFPAGTRLEIPVVGGGEGVMNLPAPLPPGGTYISEIRFPADFTSCEVHVIPSAMMP